MKIHGFTAPGFDGLRAALASNFAKNGEVGAACCIYHRGAVVADLWAGDADREAGLAWQEDTLGIVFSATKGVTAIALNLLIERGRIDPDAAISHYWPEFAAAGKKDIPVSWLLAHRAGVPLVEAELKLDEVLAWDPVLAAIAAQKPIWEPGSKHGYHVRTYGWICGELVRRVTGTSFGEFLREEITHPLQADFAVGLAAELEPRVFRLIPPQEPQDERTRAAFRKFTGPDTLLGKALHGPSDLFHYDEMWNTRALHAAEMPSSNGIGTARGLAKLYAATIGPIDGIRLLNPETLARAIHPRSSGPDAILHLPSSFGLGFALGDFLSQQAGPQAFGHPGAGGSLGMADAEAELSIAYIMNRMALGMSGDPRAARLVKAAYDAIS